MIHLADYALSFIGLFSWLSDHSDARFEYRRRVSRFSRYITPGRCLDDFGTRLLRAVSRFNLVAR
jgi:hypothetical protein